MKPIAEMTNKELVTKYNNIAKALDKPLVKRFTNRETGIRRTNDIMAEAARAVEEKKEVKEIKPESYSSHEARSAGISRSWSDPEVKRKRSQRHAVRVDGDEFRSVRQAFIHFELPLEKHIRFRMALKEAGKMDAYGMTWEVIEL